MDLNNAITARELSDTLRVSIATARSIGERSGSSVRVGPTTVYNLTSVKATLTFENSELLEFLGLRASLSWNADAESAEDKLNRPESE